MSTVVKATAIDGPNNYGYFDITLEGEENVSTKNQAIADKVREMIGQEAPAVINTVPARKAGFPDNRYLNEFAGVADQKPARRNGTGRTTQPSQGQTESNKHQAAAHALGRAVELLMASGHEYAWPLDTETLAELTRVSEQLLEEKNKLAAKA